MTQRRKPGTAKRSTKQNGPNVKKAIATNKKAEKSKVPLRIDNRTVILVTKENKTEAYASHYKFKLS